MGQYEYPLLNQWGQSPEGDENTIYANAGLGEDNVPSTAGITHNWATPNNITLASLSTANLASSGGSYVFPYIRASSFGFAIPAAATITGVEVAIQWTASSSQYTLEELKLAWGASAASLSATNKGVGQNLGLGTGDVTTYGGDPDLWGELAATLTPAVVNSEDFGFVLKPGKVSTSSSSLRIDAARMKIYYDVTVDGAVRASQTEALVLATYSEDVRITQSYAEIIMSTDAASGAPKLGRRQVVVVTT